MYTTEWSQVDFDRRAIELTVTKNGYARTVRRNSDALDAIRSKQRPRQRPSDRVFPRATEKHFQNKSWFTPVLDEAKITGATFYTCRHTFWPAMEGASIREIQEAAGHKTIVMSARYAHLSPEHTQSVVDRIATAGTNSHQNSHQSKKREKQKKQKSRKRNN
jgi:integrase